MKTRNHTGLPQRPDAGPCRPGKPFGRRLPALAIALPIKHDGIAWIAEPHTAIHTLNSGPVLLGALIAAATGALLLRRRARNRNVQEVTHSGDH